VNDSYGPDEVENEKPFDSEGASAEILLPEAPVILSPTIPFLLLAVHFNF
jgi:hypothetical protein